MFVDVQGAEGDAGKRGLAGRIHCVFGRERMGGGLEELFFLGGGGGGCCELWSCCVALCLVPNIPHALAMCLEEMKHKTNPSMLKAIAVGKNKI